MRLFLDTLGESWALHIQAAGQAAAEHQEAARSVSQTKHCSKHSMPGGPLSSGVIAEWVLTAAPAVAAVQTSCVTTTSMVILKVCCMSWDAAGVVYNIGATPHRLQGNARSCMGTEVCFDNQPEIWG